MRRSLVVTSLLLFVTLAACLTLSQALDLSLDKAPAEVYFSPHGGCTEAIVKEIGRAQSEILVQAYSFSSAPIAKALLDAHKRGVREEVILDKSQRTQRYSSATFLANVGIPTFIDGKHAIAHNKIMIIDRSFVITGSFNFTKAAEEKNAENVLVIRSKDLARAYLGNWYKHKEHAEEYRRG